MNWSGQLRTRTNRLAASQPKVYHMPQWDGYGDPKRLDVISRIAESRGRDPQIATLAVNILRKSGVKPRQFKKQAAALLKWVQDHIYYVNEPGERLQDPLYTLKVGYGDCLPESTLLLRDDYTFVPIKDIAVGDRIWGRDSWTEVQNAWATGRKKVSNVKLNNGETLTATENHKVFVWACPKHGPACPDWTKNYSNCKHRDPEVVELRVSELCEGMRLVRPESIAPGSEEKDAQRAYIEGLFVADGWFQHTYTRKDGIERAVDFAIAGKDNFPKESQKRDVRAYCDEAGIPTRWHPKYIVVKDSAWATSLLDCGHSAPEKQIQSLDLTREVAAEVLRGVSVDSSYSNSGSQVFGTTSEALSLQMRVLWHMQGQACSRYKYDDHGGLGDNPIYRMTPYKPGRNKAFGLKIVSIERESGEADCWDLTTADHYVYLPESDTVVHNCDDMTIVLYSLCRSIRLPVKLVIVGMDRNGRKVRYHQGDARYPQGVDWSHIYLAVGDDPFNPRQYNYAEPTVQGAPLGWDVVNAKNFNIPELAGFSGAGAVAGSLAEMAAKESESKGSKHTDQSGIFGLNWNSIFAAALVGSLVSVSSSFLTDAIKYAFKKSKERSRKEPPVSYALVSKMD